MISLLKRIDAFATLGKILLENGKKDIPQSNNSNIKRLETAVYEAVLHNGWFIEPNVRFMLTAIGESLSKENIEKWIEPYRENLEISKSTKTVGVVMAGNIPLVGFHDFLCVLMSGNRLLAKLSSDDNKMLPIISDILMDIEPEFKDLINFTSAQLVDIDAIIATGSNNSSRYFEYYFGKYPNIIRKNRNGIAVLTGEETQNELQQIRKDIFMYYGLGCRNVSHLFVPVGYDLTDLIKVFESDKEIANNHKYFNNYEYNKAIYLVNSTPHWDSGNLLLIEDSNFSTPVSVVSFEYYSNLNDVNRILEINKEITQCIISSDKEVKNSLTPGTSQSPHLWDYADDVDTMEFLTNL